ncbi:hypothetical protein TA3x_002287 [Tundrisphaera sp. TA3]|uniref:hypothetical protein n=1 Tax=Tundrisphaera sp. TA3 TaxID=3435775 RepID=UPI003EC093F9
MADRPTPGSSRREEVPATPAILADGRAWSLARPSTRLRPILHREVDVLGRPTEVVRLVVEAGYPAEIRRAIDRLRSECESGPPAGLRDAIVALGVSLLLRAHRLDPAFAASLFEVPRDEFPRLADAIVEVAAGGKDHDL